MPGPRDYGVGVERALYHLSRGTCYYPDCPEQVIKFVGEGTPVSNMHITHICGANPDSARYDPTMTDEERAAFANLILTCKPHHDLIDRIDPARFPVALLREWKADREGEHVSAFDELVGLTERRLAELLESAVTGSHPPREVTIEISGFFFPDLINGYSVPLAGWRSLLASNPHTIAQTERAIVITVRNVGYVPTSVESFTLDFVFNDASNKQQIACLSGANCFPLQNPRLPKSLEVGAPAVNWLTSLSALRPFIPSLQAVGEVEIRANAKLGSGEVISTETYPIAMIPFDD